MQQDLVVDGIKPLIARYLGNLPALRRGEQWKDVGIRAPTGVIEREVHRGVEPKSQTEMVFSGSFPFTRPERFVLRSLADVLDIKLREQLREELGGTYGVSVSAAPTKVPREEYTFTISFGSAPDRVGQLVTAIFTQIDSLAKFGAGESRIRNEVDWSGGTHRGIARSVERGEDHAGGVVTGGNLPCVIESGVSGDGFLVGLEGRIKGFAYSLRRSDAGEGDECFRKVA